MPKRIYFILIFLLLANACISQNKSMSAREQTDINLFNDFVNYLVISLRKNEDIGNYAHIKYIVTNYIFTNTKPDSSHLKNFNDIQLSTCQLESLKKELNTFYNFLQDHEKEHLAANLTLTPIRLSKDTFIYNRLTNFQKENTFTLCDKRFPLKTIGYVLFLPPLKNVMDKPRIWSWTLIFKFGKYMFKSVTGEEGYEYIFSPGQFTK
jgi:hypothetical protein